MTIFSGVLKYNFIQVIIDLQTKLNDSQAHLQALQASYASLASKFKKLKNY